MPNADEYGLTNGPRRGSLARLDHGFSRLVVGSSLGGDHLGSWRTNSPTSRVSVATVVADLM